ncbi:eIF2 kinase Gcn2p negative regulator [Tulasnella sp. 418]|nr:eIF2 kinase Gcn2p negative regulator [Tulasnella sp. 418]
MASYDEQLSDFLDLVLTEDPDREETVEEIKVLQSIYGPNSTRAWDATNARVTDEAQLSEQRRIEWHKGDIIRYEVLMNLPPGIQIYECEPIHDRKSAFVGRACAITHPDQVPMIIEYLRSDKKIARAAHPVIHAWRCEVNGVMHQDNDDDGETAAGGRLAHLLQILDVNQVLVVVTRYFGGIHLGPDRFKHINAAARNAIELAGFLQDDLAKKKKPSRK